MISVDFTLGLQILQFLIILVVSKKLIFDPVLATINSRNGKIQKLLNEADSLRGEVSKIKKDYEEKLQAVKIEVAEYQKKMRDEALAEASAIVGKVKAEVDDKIIKARHEIELQFGKSKSALEAEANMLADIIVDKIIGKVG
ncbi:MAG: ATP synthase F0 subunit B [Deferribacterales bacterium]